MLKFTIGVLSQDSSLREKFLIGHQKFKYGFRKNLSSAFNYQSKFKLKLECTFVAVDKLEDVKEEVHSFIFLVSSSELFETKKILESLKETSHCVLDYDCDQSDKETLIEDLELCWYHFSSENQAIEDLINQYTITTGFDERIDWANPLN
jgi:hypothetical protein